MGERGKKETFFAGCDMAVNQSHLHFLGLLRRNSLVEYKKYKSAKCV